MEPEPWVEPRGRGPGVCGIGGDLGFVCTEERFAVLCLRLESEDVLGGIFGDWPLLAFEPGDRARFDVSFIQFLSDKRWLMKGCFRRRLGTKPLGERRSGLVDTTCNMLLRDRRLSKSFAGGGGREEEWDLRPRCVSIGGSGLSSTVRLGEVSDSGNLGSSGAPCKLLRFIVLPRLFGVDGECIPSSSDSLMVGASLSSRLLAALNRLRLLASASFSLRLRSLRFALRSSFSSSSAHQPANESHRWANTFSITMSISTPAARIRCNTSFSSSVEKGAGC